MRKAVRTYLELALGVTDTSTKKVRKAVEEAVGKGGATADQIKALTSDLMAARSANREGISKLVRFEVDRALGVVGLATADEVSELTSRVRDLERQLRLAETRADATELDPLAAAQRRAANKKAVAKRATAAATLPDDSASPIRKTARKAASKTTSARTTTGPSDTAASVSVSKAAPKSAARKATAQKAAAQKATAQKSTGQKSVAQKSVARTTVARKTATKAQP